MTDPQPKPLPVLTDLNRPFWEGAAAGRLMLQKCGQCGHIRFPFGPVCTICLSPDTRWAQLSGRGEVLSHLVFHQVYHKAWAGDVPYSVVMVQLDEGPRLFSNILDPTRSDIETDLVGRRVEAVFEPLTETLARPLFRVVDPPPP